MSRLRNLSLFLVLAAAWGSAFVAIKAGLAYFPPVLFAAFRYDVAGLVMLAYAAYAVDDPIPRGRDQWLEVASGAVFIIAAYHSFLFIGETDPAVTSAVAAVIVSLSPLLTTVFARAFLPAERLTAVGALGLGIGLVGAVVLANPDPANLAGGGTVSKLLVLLAAASFALGSVLSRASEADIAIETMEAWAMLLGAGLTHLISLALGESVADAAWNAESLLALGYLSIVASGIGFLIYFDLLDRLGPIEINLVSYVAPVFAAVVGWLVLDEGITPTTVAGFLIICVGFALVKRDAIREELRAAELVR
ncbi:MULTISPECIES: DMT family transporter [Halorubrum]|uniref:PEP-CTERM protein-sorting domain-containing protein n=1 Tax=Halorubrum sodomense TaxID=35743 RepID=A0A1I6HV79_HALSD|nr:MULTISPECIES: EamA family transporter [Halorubrum]TKX54404.1 EamA/RhaT family transporter [Halorubrum sp. SP3]TKX70889.1 EamA/RhaT family transporter [Halorubrum sp. SP9]SFR58345.1 PEP-CTERM protein-sorting domain-containing protein [Halorubrum sodomense]